MLKAFIFIISITIIIIIGKNIGKFIDITEDAKKSDIIVSLGGDEGCRLQKALELYDNNFSKSNKLIYTGSDGVSELFTKSRSRYNYFRNHGIDKKNIVHINGAVNTMEELFYLKKYMLKHKYKSVVFVSHPFHSRRIISLSKYIAKYPQFGLKVNVVSCNPSDWDKKNYYLNNKNFIATISETTKLIYNMIKYSPLFIQFTNYTKKNKQGVPDKVIDKLK